MKRILLTNFLVVIAFACFAQIKVSPVQTDRVQNQNIQNVNVPKKGVAFRLSPYSLSSLPANANTVLNLTVKEFDLGNDTRGSNFVAPETGVYHFDARLNFGPPIADTKNYLRFHLILQKNQWCRN